MLFFSKIFLHTLHVLRGSMDTIVNLSRYYFGEYLGLPFALDVKGGEYLGVV